MIIRVKFGISTVEKSCDPGTTVGQLVQDANLRIELGYRDNVRVLQNGVELPLDAEVPEGATLTIEDRANQKAVSAVVRKSRKFGFYLDFGVRA